MAFPKAQKRSQTVEQHKASKIRANAALGGGQGEVVMLAVDPGAHTGWCVLWVNGPESKGAEGTVGRHVVTKWASGSTGYAPFTEDESEYLLMAELVWATYWSYRDQWGVPINVGVLMVLEDFVLVPYVGGRGASLPVRDGLSAARMGSWLCSTMVRRAVWGVGRDREQAQLDRETLDDNVENSQIAGHGVGSVDPGISVHRAEHLAMAVVRQQPSQIKTKWMAAHYGPPVPQGTGAGKNQPQYHWLWPRGGTDHTKDATRHAIIKLIGS